MEKLNPSDLQGLHELSGAKDVGLSLAAFSEALTSVAEKFLPTDANYSQMVAFYKGLHLQDFALAQSCSFGSPAAWERFMKRFQDRLYAAALVISRNEQIARDLADSLWGDLFATETHLEEGRLSKLASYSGRGSLEGWLKALLTNTYIDRYRGQKRMVSLEELIHILKALYVSQDLEQRKTDSRLSLAIEQTFCQCIPEERFLLAAYFFDRWTLKEIATALGVHESSVSRRMDRLLRELRRSINRNLQKKGMSSREIRELLRDGNWDVSVDVRGLLMHGFARQ